MLFPPPQAYIIGPPQRQHQDTRSSLASLQGKKEDTIDMRTCNTAHDEILLWTELQLGWRSSQYSQHLGLLLYKDHADRGLKVLEFFCVGVWICLNVIDPGERGPGHVGLIPSRLRR